MLNGDPDAERIAKFMLKKVNKAVYEYGMIGNNDRIAVAVSGGKDSLTLLEILLFRQLYAPEKYEVVGLHVIGDARGPALPEPVDLEKWLRERGVEYVVRHMHMSPNEKLPMTCERCTWNRRRTLFEMATEHKCNKIAFGHHLDDLAETALLNLVYHGRLETMAPSASYFGGLFYLIRPLVYVPESEIARYARRRTFPPPPPPCPLSEKTERRRMKELIIEMAKSARNARRNIVSAALKACSSGKSSKKI